MMTEPGNYGYVRLTAYRDKVTGNGLPLKTGILLHLLGYFC